MYKLSLEKAEEPEIKLLTPSESQKKARVLKKKSICFIDYSKAFDCVDHNKVWKILKAMGIPKKPACRTRSNSQCCTWNCQVGRPGKRKRRWPQTGQGKARKNETKEGPRTRVRTSGKTNNTPGWPNLHRTGPGRDRHVNRGARASSLSPSCWGALLLLSLDPCALTPQRWIFLLSSK